MRQSDLRLLRTILGEEYNLPPDAIQPEMFDFLQVVAMGARKYEMNNWLEPNGKSTSNKDMFSSCSRHLAESYAGEMLDFETGGLILPLDKESGLDPLLHVQTRCAMKYTRRKRGINNPNDHS